jgi:hypothetical protein
VTEHNPYVRFLLLLVGTALAFRLAWMLIVPLLPVIAAVCAAVAGWRLWAWHRDRW